MWAPFGVDQVYVAPSTGGLTAVARAVSPPAGDFMREHLNRRRPIRLVFNQLGTATGAQRARITVQPVRAAEAARRLLATSALSRRSSETPVKHSSTTSALHSALSAASAVRPSPKTKDLARPHRATSATCGVRFPLALPCFHRVTGFAL